MTIHNTSPDTHTLHSLNVAMYIVACVSINNFNIKKITNNKQMINNNNNKQKRETVQTFTSSS